MKDINTNLKKYIEKNILPCYDTFDHGHDSRHINAVIERALEFAKELDNPKINMNIVYTSAAYHDIGMIVARKGHAKHSHDYVLSDKGLKDFFNNEEITLIAEACEDHSTSTGRTPRSIYGKIVSDADKDNDMDISLMRAWDYSIHNFPNLTEEEHINDIHKEIVKRFGEGGSVKFYLPAEKIQSFLKQMRHYAENKEDFADAMRELLSRQQEKD